jgi:tetratricopeptide (TPR) repeat protein
MLQQQSAKEAIALAMQGRWEEAVRANKAILELSPTDVNAYNRLGRALMELGEYAQAREAYASTLKLDPNNSIARRNLSKLSCVEELTSTLKGDQRKIALDTFIEESTKVGIVNLRQLGAKEVLARVAIGDEVHLQVRGHKLVVQNEQGEYLGEVEPKHELHLIKLIENGNRYTTTIASMDESRIKLVIKEVYQHPSQEGFTSFPPKGTEYLPPYMREDLIIPEREESMEEIIKFAEEKEDLTIETNFHEVSCDGEEIN